MLQDMAFGHTTTELQCVGDLESHLQVCEAYIYLHSPVHTYTLLSRLGGSFCKEGAGVSGNFTLQRSTILFRKSLISGELVKPRGGVAEILVKSLYTFEDFKSISLKAYLAQLSP